MLRNPSVLERVRGVRSSRQNGPEGLPKGLPKGDNGGSSERTPNLSEAEMPTTRVQIRQEAACCLDRGAFTD